MGSIIKRKIKYTGNIQVNGTVTDSDKPVSGKAVLDKLGSYVTETELSNEFPSGKTIFEWAKSVKCGTSCMITSGNIPTDAPEQDEFSVLVCGNDARKTIILFRYFNSQIYYNRIYSTDTEWRQNWVRIITTTIKNDVDLNTLKTTGNYQISVTSTWEGIHCPITSYGILSVYTSSSGSLQQVYHPDNSTQIFVRYFANGTWSSWVEMGRKDDIIKVRYNGTTNSSSPYAWEIGISKEGYTPINYCIIAQNSPSFLIRAEYFESDKISGFANQGNMNFLVDVVYKRN